LFTTEVFPKERFEDLQKIPNYIVSRIWPERYPDLENALMNFKDIINDIMNVYSLYADEDNRDGYRTVRFYKRYSTGSNRDREAEKYRFHIALIHDLVFELTRAANYICDKIREHIFEGFRLKEGALLVKRGYVLGYQTYRVEYRNDQRIEFPYPGLREFMKIREERDVHIGKGIEEDYFRTIYPKF